MLSARNITFGYRGHQPILNDVTLEVAEGGRTGLVAPSGYGKSTLGKIMAGWIRPRHGTVEVDGKPLARTGVCPVQYINQNPELSVNPRWRMREVLVECWDVDQETRDSLGIEDAWLERFPGELSGGELQRFCIARVLHPGLRYLIADEMTTMLDPLTQAQICTRLVSLASQRGIGLLFISHNPALLKRLCTTIIRLDEINVPGEVRVAS